FFKLLFPPGLYLSRPLKRPKSAVLKSRLFQAAFPSRTLSQQAPEEAKVCCPGSKEMLHFCRVLSFLLVKDFVPYLCYLDLDQLTEIMKITGTPTQDFVQKLHSQDAKNYIKSLPKVQKKDFASVLKYANPLAVNLLEKMLVLDAEKRVTAAEALVHPYFEPIHDPEEEIEAEKYDDTFDNMDLPLDEWKRITYKEILNFKPPQTSESKETAV
ncbi:PREDICTED: mitogen-activated protein kinase 12-like, partial [Apaloderma vittatum]